MKFNQYTWNLYKQSSDGQKAIKEFEEANEKMTEYELFSKYNPNSAHFLSEDYFLETCDLFWACSFDSAEKPENHESAKRFYYTLTTKGIFDEEHVAVINEGEYQLMLSANDMLSFMLYYFAPEYFFPNIFRSRFFVLNKITDTFEIELPPIPKKSDYKSRCMYYWELCEVFYRFRIENQLSPAELCAFLYDYAPNFVYKRKNRYSTTGTSMVHWWENSPDRIHFRFYFLAG